MAPIRLAVLLCDTPLPSVLADEGDYHQIFSVLMHDANPGADFVMDAYDVKNKLEYPDDNDSYQGIFLTGSAHSAYEDVEWVNKLVAYTAHIVATKPECKLFGICFGHQIIGRALGAQCVPNGGSWEVGITEVRLTGLGQQIFGVQTLHIQQMHQDHVPTVPSKVKLLGSTSTCINQGMVIFNPDPSEGNLAPLTDIQVLTVQGHPEFTKSILRKIVHVRAERGVISQDLAEDAIKRNESRNDGVKIIGQTFWKVLGVDILV